MAVAEHWVGTTRGRDRSLLVPERAAWLWERLRVGFPAALSCVLMPDHLHLVVPAGRRSALRRILAAFTVRFGARFDILPPEVANSVSIAGRMVRYGYFNPVRAKLIDDPFSWPWSSLRDLIGASEPVWTPQARLREFLRLSAADTLRTLTTIGGVTYPTPTRRLVHAASIDEVRRAVRSALRLVECNGDATVERQLTVQACFEIGNPRVRDLAAALGCSVRSIHRDRNRRHAALDTTLLCLGDPRLRVGPLDDPRQVSH